jgi:hypothetical protein
VPDLIPQSVHAHLNVLSGQSQCGQLQLDQPEAAVCKCVTLNYDYP